jgi:uncharacterized repeat protein (TIGR03803 family)
MIMNWANRILRGVPAITALLVAAAAPQGAQARTYKVIHDFCQDMTTCVDGVYPNDVTLDGKGRLFGTTYEGGANNKGVVFVLKPKEGGYTYKVLYDFCPATGCADGSHPYGGLIVDGDGNVFGTAYEGGANNKGVVFALLYDGAAKAYTYKVLYSFCAQASCADGANPLTGVTIDEAGNLFGVASPGVIFKLAPNRSKNRWTFTALHSPVDAMTLLLDKSGNLFGSSYGDGSRGKGTVFKLIFDKSKGTYTFRTLHNFCTEGGDCTEGAYPYGSNVPLVMLQDGSLIGTAFSGGAQGSGVVFKLTPPGPAAGARARWSYSVLHDFCSKGGADCTDGVSPYTNPIVDANGNLYGTANQGGINDNGVLYKLVFNKSTGTYAVRALHKFCSEPDCTDGYVVYAGVVMDSAGNLFGATQFGGSYAYGGVIYQLVND